MINGINCYRYPTVNIAACKMSWSPPQDNLVLPINVGSRFFNDLYDPNKAVKESVNFTLRTSCVQMTSRQVGPDLSWSANATDRRCSCVVVVGTDNSSCAHYSIFLSFLHLYERSLSCSNLWMFQSLHTIYNPRQSVKQI